MSKDRMAAFSDGVFAIIITIMVLELRPPQGTGFAALSQVLPTFLSYVLSFIFVAIYWNNHHHLIHATNRVSGLVLWANSHLLFWLSLIPFATAWIGANHLAPLPTALYGVSLLMPAIAYSLLQRALVRAEGGTSTLAHALGADFKGKVSVVLYAVAIAAAFVSPWISIALFILVALIWFVPDRRIEKALAEADAPPDARK
jgi:uncharacterized membrane protein